MKAFGNGCSWASVAQLFDPLNCLAMNTYTSFMIHTRHTRATSNPEAKEHLHIAACMHIQLCHVRVHKCMHALNNSNITTSCMLTYLYARMLTYLHMPVCYTHSNTHTHTHTHTRHAMLKYIQKCMHACLKKNYLFVSQHAFILTPALHAYMLTYTNTYMLTCLPTHLHHLYVFTKAYSL